MNLTYKKAGLSDLDLLTDSRIEVLRAANELSDDVDMSVVAKESYFYYKDALSGSEHVAYLVFDDKNFVATGGISFYRVMPTYHNPSGKKAYIMNMYTVPEYRRRGIALNTLDLLVQEARKRNITYISLEATKAGIPLYERYGFVKLDCEMALPLK